MKCTAFIKIGTRCRMFILSLVTIYFGFQKDFKMSRLFKRPSTLMETFERFFDTSPKRSAIYGCASVLLRREQYTGPQIPPQRASFSRIVLAENVTLDQKLSDFDYHNDDEVTSTEIGNSSFWMQKMRTLHGLLDINKDGVISYDDFKLLAERFVELGHLSAVQSNEFYSLVENAWKKQWGCIDAYNLVTMQQYLASMKHSVNDPDTRKSIHQFLPYIFKAVDKNKDGVISILEFKLFFECLYLSSKDAISSFHAIDYNNDGKIELKEFIKLGREYFLTEDETKPSKLFWGPLAM